MKRRGFMRLAGGGVVLAAGMASPGARAFFSTPASAVAAWLGPPAGSELRRACLAYALLAPNPHNMQPWLADLSEPGEIVLRLDPARLLPATDPWGRQILMGAGAFLELLIMAAAEQGHRAICTLFPAGLPGDRLDARPWARVRLQPDATLARDPLFAQVRRRRTDRRAYDLSRAPSAADVARLHEAVAGRSVRLGFAGSADRAVADSERVVRLRDITREAWRIELSTEPAMMESMRVLRIGSAEIDRHRDGIAIQSPLLVLMARAGLLDRQRFPEPDSMATRSQIRDFDALAASTPAYLWVVTEGNRREQQIEAGRAYVRLNLAATAVGLSLHPNQQALQEYPQVAGPYRAVHALLDAPAPGFTVQMLARVGYRPADAAWEEPAPRRGLDALLGMSVSG